MNHPALSRDRLRHSFKYQIEVIMPRKTKINASLIIDAKAGTGKTTTLVWADNGVPKDKKPSEQQLAIFDAIGKKKKTSKTRFSCFNVSIREELQKRLPNAECVTNNALGHRLLGTKIRRYLNADKRKYFFLASDMIGNPNKNKKLFPIINTLVDLANMARVTLTGFAEDERWNVSHDELLQMAETYSVEIEAPGAIDRVEELINLGISKAYDGKIDFNDQVFLPHVFGLRPERVDRGYIDESQDLNNAQRQLLLESADQLIVVGDPNQSIYLFAGAAPDSMPMMQSSLSCGSLPLNETRRCPKSHVGYASKFLPPGVVFKAHESNPDGTIRKESITVEMMGKIVESGVSNLFISRVNSQLVKYCFGCYRQGIPASIRGKDFAATLIKKLDTLGVSSNAEAIAKLRTIADTKINAYQSQGKTELAEAAEDEYLVYEIFLTETDTIQEAKDKMDLMFSAEKLATGIHLTTAHKAKGLEAHTVGILTPELFPHPKIAAKNALQHGQEMNCAYVAHTRSFDTMIINLKS